MTYEAGILVSQPDGRRAIQPGDRPVSDLYGLHCGDGLEIWLEGRWLTGRVEYDSQGWYWTDDRRSVVLVPRMRARGYVG